MQMIEAQEAQEEWQQYLREFHHFWYEHGEPHPNSNQYLLLNRVFFYTKGLERGNDMAKLSFEPPVQPSNPQGKANS